MNKIKKIALLASAFLGVFFYASSQAYAVQTVTVTNTAPTISSGTSVDYVQFTHSTTNGIVTSSTGASLATTKALYSSTNQALLSYSDNTNIRLGISRRDASTIELYCFSPLRSTSSISGFPTFGSYKLWANSTSAWLAYENHGNYIKWWHLSQPTTIRYIDKTCTNSGGLPTDPSIEPVSPVPTCSIDNIATGWNCQCTTSQYLTPVWSWSTYQWTIRNGENTTPYYESSYIWDRIVYYAPIDFELDPPIGEIGYNNISNPVNRPLFVTGATFNSAYIESNGTWQYFTLRTSSDSFFSELKNNQNYITSFKILSSTGSTQSMRIEYYDGANWIFLPWTFQTNQKIDLTNTLNISQVRVYIPTGKFYTSGIQLIKQDYEYKKTCTVLTDAQKAQLLSGSGTQLLDSINLCGQIPIDIPLIWSAVNAVCPYFEPILKPIVAKVWPFLNFVYLPPPSTPPTQFNFFPKVTINNGTFTLGTQTGSVLFSTGQTNVSAVKLVSDESNQGVKKSLLAFIAILIYAVVLALHALVLYITFMFFSFVHKVLDGVFWASHQGNLISSIPFIGYIAILLTTVLSILIFFSFLLPILDFNKQFFLWIIVNITAFADGSYTLFHGFYSLIFGWLLVIPFVYLLYILFQKFSRLN